MYSVIIPAKNESANIERCVRSVFASVDSTVLLEVIVIDNGSSDDTAQIARNAGAKVFVKEGLHISGLRNFGVDNSSYDVIGFIDADCEALPNWLTNAHQILTSNKYIGVVGDYYRLPNQPGWIEQAYFASLPRKRRDVTYLSGGNMVLLKKIFLEVGGFEEHTVTAEDYVLCLKIQRAGYKVISDPSVSVVHHGNSKTLSELYKREIWCGYGTIDIFKNGKVTLPFIWSIMNLLISICIVISLILQYLSLVPIFLICMLILPGCAAIKHSIRNKSYYYVMQLYIIYIVYGSARTISLIRRIIS